MRKNLSREGRKKFVYDACQRSTVFWERIFPQELQMDTRTFEDLLSWITATIQKSFLGRSNAIAAEGICVTLLYLFSLLEHLWRTASTSCWWGICSGLPSGW